MSSVKSVKEIDVDLIVGFPHHNSKAKLVNDRGHLRVVERDYYWSKEKQRGLEKRRYIGYVVDNVFYDNETYKEKFTRNGRHRLVPVKKEIEIEAVKPDPLKTVVAGELPVYYALAKETGLLEDLTAVWGAERANAVLSIAFHWLHTASNAAYLYDSWSEDKLLPYHERITATETTALFRSLVDQPNWRKDFFAARVNRLPEDEVLSFDATEIASDAEEVTYAQFGKGKEGSYQNQVGLIVLMGHKTRMPVLFRVLPGNITDVTTVQDMLYRFDEISEKKRVFAAVLDRGYCSLDNLANFIDHGSRVIVAGKLNYSWIRQALEEAMSTLWMNVDLIPEQVCWGHTVPMEFDFPDQKKRKIWVHVYRDESISNIQNKAFYGALNDFQKDWDEAKVGDVNLQKSPLLKYYKTVNGHLPIPGVDTLVRDDDPIDAAVRYFGFFCNITTFSCTAADALLEYQTRDCIEKSFKAGKSYVDMETLRAHSDATTEGRFIVSFCCMTILNELYRRMKLRTLKHMKKGATKSIAPIADEMSFNQIKNYLSGIRLVGDSVDNCRWLEVTKRQHEIAERLGLPGLYENEPTWGFK